MNFLFFYFAVLANTLPVPDFECEHYTGVANGTVFFSVAGRCQLGKFREGRHFIVCECLRHE